MTPKLEETITIDFVTSASTGAAADADSTPTCEVFEDATDTAVISPAVVKRASKTGNYRIPIACTAANGFETGKSYNVIASATVGGVAAKAKVAGFQMRSKLVSDLQDSPYNGGAVASVTGAVGSVTGNVGGSVASVTGTVAGVTGNVSGSVGTVTGSVGSVLGAVGSVTAAVTLPTIPANWLTASGLATDAVTEIQAGLATAGQIPADFTGGTFSAAGVFATAALANAPTGGGGGGASAADVWAYATRTLSDKTGFSIAGTKTTLDVLNDALAAPTVAAIDTVLSTSHGTGSWLTGSGGGGSSSLDLTQVVPTTNAANTLGDCLNAARAQGFGKWTKAGSTLTLYGPDGSTVVRTFTLDDATNPTTRS